MYEIEDLLLSLIKADFSGPPQQISIDIEKLVALSKYHNVHNILLERLPAVDSLLAKDFRGAQAKNFFLDNCFGTFHDLLSANKINSIALKGIVLSKTIYQNSAQRTFSDIDLLIKKKDLEKTKMILIDNGYRLCKDHDKMPVADQYHETASKQFGGRSVYFEIHFSLFQPRIDFIENEKIWDDSVETNLNDRSVKSLSPTHNLLYLIYHLNRHYFLPLFYFCDIDRLISKYSNEIDWNYIAQFCMKRNKNAVIFIGLRLCRELFGTKLPDTFLQNIYPGKLSDQIYSLFFNKKNIMQKRHTFSKNAATTACKSMIFERSDLIRHLSSRAKMRLSRH